MLGSQSDNRKPTGSGLNTDALLKAVRKVSASRAYSPPGTRRTSPSGTPMTARRKVSTMSRTGPLKLPNTTGIGTMWGSTVALARKVSVGQNMVVPTTVVLPVTPTPGAGPSGVGQTSWLSVLALNEGRDIGRSLDSIDSKDAIQGSYDVREGLEGQDASATSSAVGQTLVRSSSKLDMPRSRRRSRLESVTFATANTNHAETVSSSIMGGVGSVGGGDQSSDADGAPEVEEPVIVGQKQALASAVAEKGASSAVRDLEQTRPNTITLAFAEQKLEMLYCLRHSENMRMVSLMHVLCAWGALQLFLACDILGGAGEVERRRIYFIRCVGGTALCLVAAVVHMFPITRTGQWRTGLFLAGYIVISIAALLVNSAFSRTGKTRKDF
eukprot:Opistho-2@22502